MIGNNHQVANLKAGVHATGGIGYEERLDAQFVHHADGECHLFHRVALVVVEASLHGQDVNAAQLAEDKLSAVALNGRHREVRDVRIGNLLFVSYF